MPPSITELKALAATLPPSERVAAGEVADVLSGLSAFVTYGEDLLAAAEKGSAEVYDFFHDHLTAQAKDAGNPEPERGQVPTPADAAAPVATGAAPAIDYDKLAAAIVAAQHSPGAAEPGAGAPPADAQAPAPGAPPATGEGTAATGDTPAGAPAQGAGAVESGGVL